MRNKVITGLLLLLPFLGFSQGEFNKWYFGVNAGIDFNSTPPVGLSGSAMNTMYVSACVADSLGNLLFYSQGLSVYNRNHQVMPNGNGLFGGQQTQGVFAVKKPGSENLYFLFTVYFNLMPINYGLYYSLIDMNLNGGLGDIVSGSKNIPVAGGEDVVNGIHGTRHFNNHDAWIVVRKTATNEYAAYRVTSSGISTTPVLSSCSVVGCGFNSCGYVELKISQDGTKYVFVSNNPQQGLHFAEVGLFNCNTGVLTPVFQFRPVNPLNLAFVDPRAIEFSPDSKRLYVATTYYTAGTSRFIFQYDLSFLDSTQFMQSQLLLSSTHEGHYLQLGSDGKIYQTVGNFDSLNVINNPNVHGLGCNFQTNAIALASGTFNHSGLPQLLQRYKAYIHSSGQCQGHPVTFSGDIWPPADTTKWNFGDPASGASNVSTQTTPTHLYANPGTYTVTLYVRHNDNRTDTTWKSITILPSPVPTVTGPATAAIGQTTTYTTQAGMSGYTWSVSSGGTITSGGTPTDNTASVTWNAAGTHQVFVNYTNNSGCSAVSPAVIQVTVGSGPPALYEFWFAAPAVTYQRVNWYNMNNPIAFYLMTAEGPANVVIDQPSNPSFVPIIKTVNNDSARRVDLTPFIDSVENKPANTVLNRGLHITSDKQISVIYEVESTLNAATYTLAGKNALGYEFIIPAQSHFSNHPDCSPPARNSFDIVATEDSTLVRILPRQAIIGHAANDTFSIILNRGQTWSGRATSGDSTKHLGGSFVFADKPVAVTVTDDALFIPGNSESVDIAGDQLMPRHLCGTEFIPVSCLDPGQPKLIIYAFENGTHVTLTDTSYVLTADLNRGESTELVLEYADTLSLSQGYAGYLISNKPILVYQQVEKAILFGDNTWQAAASILPPISCAGSNRVCLPRTPPYGLGGFYLNDIYWTIVTKNGNQGNFQVSGGFPVAVGGFRTVPGTNGAYVFGISSVTSGGGIIPNIIFTNNSGRFQLASGSSTNNITVPSYNYFKYSYYSDYATLFLGNDRSICPGDSLFLDAGYGKASYLWSTGATTQSIWVRTAGTYWVSTIEPDCSLSDTIVISYYPSTPVNLGPDRSICAGDSALLNAGPGRSWYLWSTGATTQSIWAKNSGTYWVKTSGGHCDVFDTVAVSTIPPPSITTTPLAKTICTGESTNIALAATVTGTIFHWTATLTSGNITGFSADSGQVINQTLINIGTTTGVVTYHITPKKGDCTGPPVDYVVTVNIGDPVDVTITASGNTVCAGATVTFTAIPVNPGTSPVYQWKVNGVNAGSNALTFSYSPVNGDIVKCILTSSNVVCTSNNPATSNSISMVVNPLLPVSVTVSPSSNPVCAGAMVNFTATPGNCGTTPQYQWKVNGLIVGTNSPGYSYVPINGDAITCTLTSNVLCPSGNPAISNTVTMTVKPILPVGVSIVASSNPFCLGTTVTFTATPVNGGLIPGYQWKVNGINAGTNNPVFVYSPATNDVITCSLLSSETCTSGNPALSNPITMVVNANLPAGITIAASSNPFCPGSAVNFTATPVNGGSNPTYQWKVNGINSGTNSASYSYVPVNNDSVRCVITSNLSCVSGNPASSAKIIMIGTLAPSVAFSACFDTITTVNAKPFQLKGGLPLGGTYSGPGVNSSTGIFTPSVAGIGVKTINYSYINVHDCGASKSKSIVVQPYPSFSCGNNLIDARDNKVYPTVQIGSQCWMQKNLEYGITIPDNIPQTDNCIAEKYQSSFVNRKSYMYQWDEMMKFDDTPAGQGLCPPGWHVPTETEWTTLMNYYQGNSRAGRPLQDTIVNGFKALRSGVFYLNSSWSFLDFATILWSSTSSGQSKALSHGMNLYNFSVSLYPASRGNAFGVRCLRD